MVDKKEVAKDGTQVAQANYEVVEVATQTTPVILDSSGKQLDIYAALAVILNDLALIKKGVL